MSWARSVSVVVCTYAEERLPLLREALAGVLSQQPPPDEVIVVVDHNERLSARLRDELGADLRVVDSAGPRGLSGARNTGVAVAAGDVVAFLDDDAVPRPGWLAELTAPFEDATVAGTGGRVVPRWESGARPGWFPEELDWVVGCSYRGQQGPEVRNPIGASMALRARVLDEVGGFSTELGRVGTLPVGCEETELGLRVNAAGGRVVLVDGSVVDHLVPAARATVRYVVRRCFSEGASKAVVRRLAAEAGAAGGALGTERRYLLSLASGVARAARRSVVERSPAAAGQMVLLPASLAAAALGFVRASLRRSSQGGAALTLPGEAGPGAGAPPRGPRRRSA